MVRLYTRVTPKSTPPTVVVPAGMFIEILSWRLCDDIVTPRGTDLHIDACFLPNPVDSAYAGKVDPQLSGLDEEMKRFLEENGAVDPFFNRFLPVVIDHLHKLQSTGHKHARIICKCFGGKHRSVFLARRLVELLRAASSDWTVQERHPQLEDGQLPVPESLVQASESDTATPTGKYTYDPESAKLRIVEVRQQSSEDMQKMLSAGLARVHKRRKR